MKKRIAALSLALPLVLSGCASLLERDYLAISPNEPVSASGGSSSALQVENYQGLVNAILYLVTQGEEHGVLTLYNYTRDVEADLTSACLEVVQEDPLGAYAVDYIKHDYAQIVSYYEANITITYRRTPEQLASIVSVTGSSALRRELRNTLTGFEPEAVLRISYFVEDEDYIRELVRQAYYDAPVAALGMPEMEIALYPNTGRQRIVEILLSYGESPEVLRRRSQELQALARDAAAQGSTVQSLYQFVQSGLTIEEGTGHSSAYDALVEGVADSEGAALAYQLLCNEAKVTSTIVLGERNGAPHVWNIITNGAGESRHVDLSAGLFAVTDNELCEAGDYQWDRALYPGCGEPGTEPEPDVLEDSEEPEEPEDTEEIPVSPIP